jgi:hypothetical protein
MSENSQEPVVAVSQLRERAMGTDYFQVAVYWMLGALLLGQLGVMFWLNFRS